MTEQELEILRYPTGRYKPTINISKEKLGKWISVLEHLPNKLSKLVLPLTNAQLDTPYRPEGWTVRQVVHHISDSHHHSYIRFKWALTEDKPTIKPYFEERWANLFDTKTAPIQMSLDHISAVHFKLVYLLKGLTDDQLNRSFIHSETNTEVMLRQNVGIYAWHSEHHYAHIKNLLKRKNWL